MAVIAYLDMTSPAADRLVAAYATDEDRAAADHRRTAASRNQRLSVRALLRSLLAEHEGESAGWRLTRDDDGAPRLHACGGAEPPYCSLSHSGHMVACALDPIGRIGIDIERIRTDRRILEISEASFGPSECAAVECGGAEAFYRVWTLREALAKASGAGFSLLLNRVDMVPVSPDAPPDDRRSCRWRYWRLPEPYGLGVALTCPPAEMADLAPIRVS